MIHLLPADAIRFIDLQDSIYNYQSDQMGKRYEVDVDERVLTTSSRGSGKAKYTTVRRGDTLGAIARRNHTTVARLRQLNGIRGNNIKAGKKIRVK